MICGNQVNRICRTCLTPEITDNTGCSLNTVIHLENGESRQISKIMENCINLEVTSADKLPQVICKSCTTIIRNFYVFRDKCHKNDRYLREQLENLETKDEVKTENVVLTESNFPEIELIVDSDVKKEIHVFDDSSADRVSEYSSHEYDTDSKDSDFKVENTEDVSQPSNSVSVKDNNSDEEHAQDKQKMKNHKCDICCEMFDGRRELLFHRRANHINEISDEYYTIVRKDNKTHYICKICKKFCKHKNILRVHLRMHTGEKPYTCIVCSLSFTQKDGVRRHMKTHKLKAIDQKSTFFYKCELCEEGFETEDAVKFHYAQKHPAAQERNRIRDKLKPVEKLCEICGKYVKGLPEHLRLHAGGAKKVKKYECKICGNFLSTSSSLSKHLQRHSDEKKIVCDTCGKTFKTQHDINLHRKIHEEPKFECQLCGRKFIHKRVWQCHLRVHAGEKPYKVYDDRKKEKRRLMRLEMMKNGTLLPKTKTQKKKKNSASTQE